MGGEDLVRGVIRWGLTLVVLLAAVAVVVLGGLYLLGGGTAQEVEAEAVQMSSVERALIGVYLNLRKNVIESPASSDSTAVVFAINPGETAATIAPRLQREGLVADSQLFLYLVRYRGVDARLEAGEY